MKNIIRILLLNFIPFYYGIAQTIPIYIGGNTYNPITAVSDEFNSTTLKSIWSKDNSFSEGHKKGKFTFLGKGTKPVKNIGKCKVIDNIDVDLKQVMFQTNEVDDQKWSEIDLDDTVWKYSPQGNRY